jgi:sodium transport system permease protein
MIRLEIVRTVFMKELREMLRDRRSLAVMFGLPLVLYPLLAIGISSLGQSKRQQLTEQPARVAIPDAEAAPELFARLKAKGSGIELTMPGNVEWALSRGVIDAVIDVPERAQERAIAGEPVEITVRLDRSRSVSGFVETKVDKALDEYERWVLEQRLKRYGAPREVLEPLKTTTVDVATGDKVFGRILSQMLPLLLLMTGMLGALFPALNATTTERELGTLETLLVTPAGRTELLLAKGALVLISALLTAGLNMLSMSLVLLKAVSTLEAGSNFTISPGALLLSYVAAIPALIFFSAIVLIVGLLARNFREANAFATPTMLLPLVAMAVGIAEPEATPGLLITPVANTTVIIREVLTGRVSAGDFVLAFASSCLFAGIVLSLAGRVFSSEQLVNPAWEPVSLRGFTRGRGGDRPRRLPPVDAALFLFITTLLLVFYLQPSPPKWSLVPIVVVNQLLLILAPALLFAWLGRWKWRETFKLYRAPLAMLAAAALLGAGLGPWINLISGLQQTFWPRDPNSPAARMTGELIVDALSRHPVLAILVVGTLAGVCEEMLFRGPIQTALVRKLPVRVALAITAFLFAAAHMDLHGMPIRFGLGLLLGWLVWRGGSIFPAMLAHGLYDATQLAVAAVKIRYVGREQALAEQAFTVTGADVVMLAVGAAFIVAAILLIRRTPSRPIDASPAPGTAGASQSCPPPPRRSDHPPAAHT